MSKRKALGKGMSALIGDAKDKKETAHRVSSIDAMESGGKRVREVPVDSIMPNPYQARRVFNESAMNELTDSIRQSGILQPMAVRAMKDGSGRFELIAGERRLRAARKAGLKTVPVIAIDVDDREMSVLSLVENLQREDLNPIDEAEGFQKLIEGFQLTQEDVAGRVGKSRSAVANVLRLLGLPETVKKALAAAVISEGHGRALLALGQADKIISAFGEVVHGGLSVRETERHVRKKLEAHKNLREGAEKKAGDQAGLDPNMTHLVGNLAERFGTKIKLSGTSKRGKLEIHYFSAEDRDRILEILSRMS
jgi:ParB family transcriptional regulator, chromosome partitioning protein